MEESYISKYILAQIIVYCFFVLSFFLNMYNNIVIYMISMFGIFLIAFYFYLRMLKNLKTDEKWVELYPRKKLRNYIKIIYFIILIIIIFFLLSPINIFYTIFNNFIFKSAIGLKFCFHPIYFGFWFFWLFIFSIVSEIIIGLYYYISKEPFPTGTGFGIWDYFLKNISVKNMILLIILLSVASIFEEILFRFFLINFLLLFNLNIYLIIIIGGIIFGSAHYSNGGWIYIVNSTFAGIIFGFAFVQYGIFFAWILHFLWNFIIIAQMFIPLLYERRKEKKLQFFKFK